eukprot:261454-Rhodomonas_salina.1
MHRRRCSISFFRGWRAWWGTGCATSASGYSLSGSALPSLSLSPPLFSSLLLSTNPEQQQQLNAKAVRWHAGVVRGDVQHGADGHAHRL